MLLRKSNKALEFALPFSLRGGSRLGSSVVKSKSPTYTYDLLAERQKEHHDLVVSSKRYRLVAEESSYGTRDHGGKEQG